MLTPPAIMAIAISRNDITLPLIRLIKNRGRMKPRIILYITTKRGRAAPIVETRDIGPLAIAQNANTIASSASVSLKTSKAIAEFLCFISLSFLIVLGRNAATRKTPDRLKKERL